MDDKRAYICLNLIPGVGPVKVSRLISYFGGAAEIFKQSFKTLKSVEGIGPKLAELITAGPEKYNPDDEIRLAEQAGVQIISFACAEYPEMLSHIADPPLVLYIRGQLESINRGGNSIAVVGSRRPSHYGINMAKALSVSAVSAGWVVVSGLATGIDTAAHKATLEAGGLTVAVLGSGLGRLYPQENLDLARQITEKGAVISEFPMNYPPDKRSFPMRNRIISGITAGTIVVEAGVKSGTLITADQAAEQGRTVFAVPGRADQPHSRGCHRLIRTGAVLIESFADVLEDFNSASLFESAEIAPVPQKNDSAHTLPVLTLRETEQKIVEFLTQGEVTVDNMVEELQLSVGTVFATLIEMETKRLVKPLPGRRYALRN